MNDLDVKKDFEVNNNIVLLISLLLFGYLLFTYLSNKFIFTDSLYYYSLGNQFSADSITKYLSFKSKVEWLGYLTVPVIFLIKISLITVVLYTGTILSDIKVTFKKLFHVVLQAEFVFLFAFFIKIYWIYVFMSDVSVEKISFFQPLSILNFFSIGEIPKWFVYPLQLLNLFEIAYMLLLADLLKKIIKRPFWKSVEFVLSTYGVGLLIWAVFVVFLTLNLT